MMCKAAAPWSLPGNLKGWAFTDKPSTRQGGFWIHQIREMRWFGSFTAEPQRNAKCIIATDEMPMDTDKFELEGRHDCALFYVLSVCIGFHLWQCCILHFEAFGKGDLASEAKAVQFSTLPVRREFCGNRMSLWRGRFFRI